MTTLFDNGLERTDTGGARYAEPSFPYWNRSARKDIAIVRPLLEDWFSRYPTRHAADLRNRFRSKDDVQHRGAFFELFLHEMLLRLKCSVEVHPDVPGTPHRPEFLVASLDGSRFYLEAKVATGESDEAAAARARTDRVYEAINEMDSPDFWINVEVRGTPASQVPTSKLKKFLTEKLASTDYDDTTRRFQESGLDALPRWKYAFEGWSAEFFPIPKVNARGEGGVRPMGLQMFGVRWIDSVTPVRNAILAKAKRYGTPDLPYVIAINALDDYVEEEDVAAALFGDECFLSRFEGDPPQFSRKPNGVWTSPHGQYTRVSAVLVFRKLFARNFPAVDVRLFHHPLAAKPYIGPLTEVPQEIVADGRLTFQSGTSLANIFGVLPTWLEDLDD